MKQPLSFVGAQIPRAKLSMAFLYLMINIFCPLSKPCFQESSCQGYCTIRSLGFLVGVLGQFSGIARRSHGAMEHACKWLAPGVHHSDVHLKDVV